MLGGARGGGKGAGATLELIAVPGVGLRQIFARAPVRPPVSRCRLPSILRFYSGELEH